MDGVQGNDELLRRGTRSTPTSRGGPRDCRPCHSLDQLRAGRGRPSDRGLVRPAGNHSGLPQTATRNARAIQSRSSPSLLAGTRYGRTLTRPGAWISVYSRVHGGRVKKSQKINGTRNVCSLDIRGHIGVSHVSRTATVVRAETPPFLAVGMTTPFGRPQPRELLSVDGTGAR